MKRFRGGLVFKAHRLVHHSTLGWRVIKKREDEDDPLRSGVRVLVIQESMSLKYEPTLRLKDLLGPITRVKKSGEVTSRGWRRPGESVSLKYEPSSEPLHISAK